MASKVEPEIQRVGRDIFAQMERATPSIFKKDFWNGKIMDWSMRDDDFKVEMFRFVDVFPVLHSPETMARHLQEYFCRPEQDFPAWIQLGLKSVSATSLIARKAAGTIEKNIRSMASDFVAGVDARDALSELESLRAKGRAFTVDLLGEATVSEAEAHEYQERYFDLIRTLSDAATAWSPNPALDRDASGEIPRVNVSIKITSLYSQLDPADPEGSIAALRERLLPLFVEARRLGVFLNIDMESYAVKDLTLAMFKALLEDPALDGWDDAGIVIQAYLRDSYADLEDLIKWAKTQKKRIRVRLVKGAYWDYETIHARQYGWPIPVYQHKGNTDANYEACLDLLLKNHKVVRTAIASHNVRSLAAGIALATRYKVPAGDLEIQMLYGMADPMKTAIQKMGFRLREYVPVGELIPGMAYLVRRLLENTSNEGFLKAKFHDDADPTALLAAPVEQPEDPTPRVDSPFINEPHIDFARAEHRAAMVQAMQKVRAQLGRHYPAIIDGETVDTERRLSSPNPANPAEVIGTTACATVADAERAVMGAWAAFPDWRDRPSTERTDIVRSMADIMRRRRFELSAWIVLENGKNWREADADVAEAIDFCRYYADEADRLMTPRRLGHYPGELNHLVAQPMGVGTIIAPWNFPIAILTGMTVGAVATGNCVVMKPAEQTPIIAAKLMEIAREAGVPDGVIQFVPGIGEEVGAALVEHRWTRFIAFTGSRPVGLQILRKAYDTHPAQPGVKRVVCEMGGKNAIIVDDDADLDEAVAAVIYSAFGFQGQKCSACSRAIVLAGNYDAFVERLVEAARSLEVGPPENPAYAYGPVIDEEARAKVLEYIEIGKQEGTPLLITQPPGVGTYVPFAIFADIRPEHRLAQEEVFGPVLAVMKAEDFDEAISIANGTSYALTGGIISRSPAHIERARKELRVGNLYINRGCTGALVYRQPFGGFKYSGLGHKAGGPHYLTQFVEERAISENTMRRGFAPED